ncbi:MAG: NAD(P)-dependent alcohol dehydrogenase [Mycobacterium sp.]
MGVGTTAAVVTTAGGPFELTEVELDELRPDELLVRMVATGVCHTDLNARAGALPFPLPAVLGHEGVGIVEAVGPRVTKAEPGDKVLMTFTSCGHCSACRRGHPAYCTFHLPWNLLGGRRADGTATVSSAGREINAHFFGQSSFARRAIADERSVVTLPWDTSMDELVTLAPLACGLQTGAGAIFNVLRPGIGSVLVVTGAGAVGLAAVMAAATTAVRRIIAVDRIDERLELARALGATDTINAAKSNVAEELRRLTSGAGFDHAVETTGNTGVLETLCDGLAIGGHVAVIGAPAAGARASFDVNAFLPGRQITGVTLGDSQPDVFIPQLLQLYRDGRFPLDRMQRRYRFEDIEEACADAASGRTVKPILTFDQSLPFD